MHMTSTFSPCFPVQVTSFHFHAHIMSLLFIMLPVHSSKSIILVHGSPIVFQAENSHDLHPAASVPSWRSPAAPVQSPAMARDTLQWPGRRTCSRGAWTGALAPDTEDFCTLKPQKKTGWFWENERWIMEIVILYNYNLKDVILGDDHTVSLKLTMVLFHYITGMGTWGWPRGSWLIKF